MTTSREAAADAASSRRYLVCARKQVKGTTTSSGMPHNGRGAFGLIFFKKEDLQPVLVRPVVVTAAVVWWWCCFFVGFVNVFSSCESAPPRCGSPHAVCAAPRAARIPRPLSWCAHPHWRELQARASASEKGSGAWGRLGVEGGGGGGTRGDDRHTTDTGAWCCEWWGSVVCCFLFVSSRADFLSIIDIPPDSS